MPVDTNDLLEQGSACAAAGRTNEAIALWQQAARRGNVGGFLNIGTLYMQLALVTDDEARRQAFIKSAVSAFMPIAPPEFHAPDAAFSLGMIAEHLGDEEKAAGYFRQAAAMPQGMNPEQDAPTQAMLKLADYALKGRGGMPQDAAVAEDWILKAQARHAELFAEAEPESQPTRPINTQTATPNKPERK